MQLLKRELMRVIPICFVIGSSVELFMIQTGFYDIVTRKEGERRAERLALEKERDLRLKELRIKLDLDDSKK
jgi:hypothetical protein